jgi:hypothetical protein
VPKKEVTKLEKAAFILEEEKPFTCLSVPVENQILDR